MDLFEFRTSVTFTLFAFLISDGPHLKMLCDQHFNRLDVD